MKLLCRKSFLLFTSPDPDVTITPQKASQTFKNRLNVCDPFEQNCGELVVHWYATALPIRR